jgi:RNA recognition motif-containing protein
MYAARVVTDRISGYSRGFGFVKYTTVEEAGEAIKGMDGKVRVYMVTSYLPSIILLIKQANHIYFL